MHQKLIRRIAYSLVALFVGFVAGLFLFRENPLLAALCPACFGFEKVAPSLYVEKSQDEAQRAFVLRHKIALDRVARALGPLETSPRVLACVTPACNERLGGHQTRGLTYGAHLIYLGPEGLTTEILAHELAHVRLHRKIGLSQLTSFPTWVDEGMAVFISRDTRFDLDPATCAPGDEPLPDSAKVWRRSQGARDGSYYAQAGCRVAQWLDQRGLPAFEESFDALIRESRP